MGPIARHGQVQPKCININVMHPGTEYTITATTKWDLPGLYYTSNQNYPHRQNISLLDSISKEALNSHHTHVYIHEQFPSNIQNINNRNCAKITLLLMSLFSFYHNLRKIINYNHLTSYHIWENDIIIGDCICMIRNIYMIIMLIMIYVYICTYIFLLRQMSVISCQMQLIYAYAMYMTTVT